MKRVLLVYVYSIYIGLHAVGGADTSLFVKGNQLYQQGNYQEALGCYQSLEEQTPAVLYNQANCLYMLNNKVKALAYWHKARKNCGIMLLPDILDNIASVEKQLGFCDYTIPKKDKNPEGPQQHFSKVCTSFFTLLFYYIDAVSLLSYQILFLLFLLCGVIFITRSFLYYIWLVLLYIVSFLILSKYYMLTQMQGIIIQDKIMMYSGPGFSYQVVGSVPIGATCLIKDSSYPAYYKIMYNKKTGWIHQDAIERLYL